MKGARHNDRTGKGSQTAVFARVAAGEPRKMQGSTRTLLGTESKTGGSTRQQKGRLIHTHDMKGRLMVYEILNHGAENAQSATDLCKVLGVQRRELVAAVQRERKAGKPICASTSGSMGYFIAADQDEMTRYCESLLHRENEITAVRKACLTAAQQLPVAPATREALYTK